MCPHCLFVAQIDRFCQFEMASLERACPKLPKPCFFLIVSTTCEDYFQFDLAEELAP
jgi:hypothetical protein